MARKRFSVRLEPSDFVQLSAFIVLGFQAIERQSWFLAALSVLALGAFVTHMYGRLSKSGQLAHEEAYEKAYVEAKSCFDIEDYLGAIRCLNSLIHSEPSIVDGYVLRAHSWARLCYYSRAIDDYKEAIVRGGFEEDLWLCRGLSFLRLSRGNAFFKRRNYERALDDLDKSIENFPGNRFVALNNRASCFYWLSQFQDAIKDYSSAILLNPIDAMTYVRRGEVYRAIDEHSLAAKDFNKAIQLGWDQRKHDVDVVDF